MKDENKLETWMFAWAMLAVFGLMAMTLQELLDATVSWEPFVAGMFVLQGLRG